MPSLKSSTFRNGFRAIAAVWLLFAGLWAIKSIDWVGPRPVDVNSAGASRHALPPDERALLRERVAHQKEKSERDLDEYRPESATRIDDLDQPVVELLKGLPGVVEVEHPVKTAEKPTARIIHLRDWHFVPRDLYAADMSTAYGRGLNAAEIERLHEELLLQVELVQIEQLALLRCLARHHGLKRLFAEGVTERDYSNFVEITGVLAEMEREQSRSPRMQVAEFRVRLARTGFDPNRKRLLRYAEGEVAWLIGYCDRRVLQYGLAMRFVVAMEGPSGEGEFPEGFSEGSAHGCNF